MTIESYNSPRAIILSFQGLSEVASSFRRHNGYCKCKCLWAYVNINRLIQEGQSDLGERGGITRCVDLGVVVSGDSLIERGGGEAIWYRQA